MAHGVVVRVATLGLVLANCVGLLADINLVLTTSALPIIHCFVHYTRSTTIPQYCHMLQPNKYLDI